jgi:hypothetical protein
VHLLLNAPSDETALLTAFDLNGKKIYERSVTVVTGENRMEFPMNVTQGIYLFHVATNSHTYTQKVLLQN